MIQVVKAERNAEGPPRLGKLKYEAPSVQVCAGKYRYVLHASVSNASIRQELHKQGVEVGAGTKSSASAACAR